MADYIVANGTGSALTNINAGGDDVPAYGYGVGGLGVASTLSDGELGTLLGNPGVLAIISTSSQEQRRLASKVLRLGKNPGANTAADF